MDRLTRLGWTAFGGLFLFVAVSGALIAFHLYPYAIWWSHGWAGLVLLASSFAFACRYWRLVKPRLAAILSVSMLALFAGLFVRIYIFRPPPLPPVTESTQQILAALTHMPLDKFAPVFGGDADRIADRLRETGFTVASNRQSLDEIARATGRKDREALAALTELLWANRGEAKKAP
jgi:hypothetical protein